jgi:hypothetical protein
MDAKITLSFDENVIAKAKAFAEKNNMSLSRLTEYLFHNITSGHYKHLEELPIADWVNQVAEGEPVYLRKPRSGKQMKAEYFESRKKKR